MSKELIAKRYAVALFQLAQEQNQVDKIESDLLVVKEVFAANKELFNVFNHPKVSADTKKSILKDSFSALSEQVVNTLYLLVDRHRIANINEIVSYFVEIANEARGTEDAIVYSVRPLTDVELSAISTSFAKKIGKVSLRLQNIVDKNLLGGVKLRIGNRIYDGSISGKLERIERQLVANRL
ncbi:F0F1 ATP synthase subunit delta [Metabacillus malikii]|uniref:ATP synthase subunit delta n=1 Tax=Metabacillus malikii TaxID=1504265 RepID=A0ABT9ZIM2_9BACI|nr:F0F1 ATP synthase subunit delta [Metabacillus malikii]MDQ0232120.1 F-type H+-transporting ATPase subunit delta [Metabacillus malikii]